MTDAAPGSALDRLRTAYAARQEADPARYVEVWDDGALYARIARSENLEVASGVMRSMTAIMRPDVAEQVSVTVEDLADIVAAATVSLHELNGDGTPSPEPLKTDDGTLLRFDQAFAEVIGVPEVQTPRAAVFAAFTSPVTEDGPPQLDTLKLMTVATQVCTILVAGREAAQITVGKASTQASDATQP